MMDGGNLPLVPQAADPPQPEVRLHRDHLPRIAGRYTPTEAARMLLKTQTMDEIRRVALQLRLTERQAHMERLRLFHMRYGI